MKQTASYVEYISSIVSYRKIRCLPRANHLDSCYSQKAKPRELFLPHVIDSYLYTGLDSLSENVFIYYLNIEKI